MIDRTHRELSEDDIARIAGTYHAWRGEPDAGKYEDIPGFCSAAAADGIREHGHVLTPGRYVGAEELDDDEPFEKKLTRLTTQLKQQLATSARLESAIRKNLAGLGFSIRGLQHGGDQT